MSPRPNLLTLAEAADLLSVTPAAMYTMRARGYGPVAYRLGDGPRAQLRYAEADVLAWLDARREDPADHLQHVG